MRAPSPSAASPGQNLFGTAGATGFYIDDTPVPGSIDPRVVDLASIEVLKGPQGTLFGESSLGGNVRLITRQPNLTESAVGYMAEAGATSGGGSADGGVSGVANMVLIPSTLALRVVMYGNHDAGYLHRSYPTDKTPTTPAPVTRSLSCPRTSVGDQGAMHLVRRLGRAAVAGEREPRREAAGHVPEFRGPWVPGGVCTAADL